MIGFLNRVFVRSNPANEIVSRLINIIAGRAGINQDRLKEIKENFQRNFLDLAGLKLTDEDITRIFFDFDQATLTNLGKNIVAVDLSDNELSKVPEFLNYLSRLSILNISSNKIQTIDLAFLKKLSDNYRSNVELAKKEYLCLDLGGNPNLINSGEIIALFTNRGIENSLFISDLSFQHRDQNIKTDELDQRNCGLHTLHSHQEYLEKDKEDSVESYIA